MPIARARPSANLQSQRLAAKARQAADDPGAGGEPADLRALRVRSAGRRQRRARPPRRPAHAQFRPADQMGSGRRAGDFAADAEVGRRQDRIRIGGGQFRAQRHAESAHVPRGHQHRGRYRLRRAQAERGERGKRRRGRRSARRSRRPTRCRPRKARRRRKRPPIRPRARRNGMAQPAKDAAGKPAPPAGRQRKRCRQRQTSGACPPAPPAKVRGQAAGRRERCRPNRRRLRYRRNKADAPAAAPAANLRAEPFGPRSRPQAVAPAACGRRHRACRES